MLRFDKTTNSSLLFNCTLSGRLSNNQCGSYVLLFSESINTVSLLYYTFIGFIIFLYTF